MAKIIEDNTKKTKIKELIPILLTIFFTLRLALIYLNRGEKALAIILFAIGLLILRLFETNRLTKENKKTS